MTNDRGSRAMVDTIRRAVGLSSGVALIGFLALIVGLFLDSSVAQTLCFLLAGAAGVFLLTRWRLDKRGDPVYDTGSGEKRAFDSSDATMKKLLFDDFQSLGAKYVVKEIDEQLKVVPSSKSAAPVAINVKPETVREFEIPDFFDLDSDGSYADVEPKAEFHSLLNKVLLVLKDVLFANTVAFFWANREKQQLVLEAMATDSTLFIKEKRFTIEEDLVSQVAKSGKPQVLGKVNPGAEKDLVRYYTEPCGIQSMLGVPVYFMNGAKDLLPVGVIVADSKAEDAFGSETLALLTRFTKLVSGLIKSYTDKYELLLDSELLASIRRMQDRIKSDPTEHTVLAALAEETNRLANWDCLTVTMYADEQHGWVVQKVVNKTGDPYVTVNQTVDMGASVVGEAIDGNTVKTVENLERTPRVRFCPDEPMASVGSFLCIPISSINRCYGAMTLESKTASNFSGGEVETIYRLVENAAGSLEVLYMNEMVKDCVAVDELTQSLTQKHFTLKIEEEVRRADDFGADLALVSIALDGMDDIVTRYGRDGFDVIINEVAGILRKNIRTYDILGRHEEAKLGVLFVNTPANDAYIWAEKIRKLIASHVITVGNKTISVTVSAGVCGLTEGMEARELVAGTSQVLGKAMENGGNLVRIF